MPSRATSAVAAIGVVVGATLVAAPAATADGGMLYVSKSATSNCSDSGTGTQAQPYCSLQVAVDAARPGDTVQVLTPGNYGPVHVTTSGTESAPITVTTRAARFLPSLSTTTGQSPLFFDHVHDVVFHHFSVLAESSATAGVTTSGSSRVTVDGGQIREDALGAPGVRVDGGSSAITLSNNTFLSYDSAHPVTLAAGASGTVLTGNTIYHGSAPAIQADDAPGTVVVSNTLVGSECSTDLALNGATTGAVVENNAITREPTTCATPTGAPVVLSQAAAADVVWDYNTVESPSAGAVYSWAGQDYPTPDALHGATGQGAHDTSLTITSATTWNERAALLIDSADANAPHEPATDRLGNPRVDDPLVANTGSGPGSYDRGSTETQDPFAVTAGLSAAKGPAPFTETVTATAGPSPWHSTITGYTFDFGDGSAPVASDRPTASHTYTTTGSYTVTAKATASSGTTVTATSQVQVVADAPLVPALALAIKDLTSSLSVQADGLTTTDSWSIAHYTFDFGDGSAPQTAPGYSGYAGHTYAAPGTYTVTMTVTDDGGRTATTTRQVTVGSVLVPVDPVRVLDTRVGTGAPKGKVGPGGVVRLKVAGVNGLPATGVTAVTFNLTGVDATAATFVTAYPDGRPRPTASNLNLASGQAVPNLVTVPVSADGYVDIYNHVGAVNLIADIEGYYTTAVPAGAGSKAGFVQPTAPTRLLDTRSGLGANWAGPVGPGQAARITVPSAIQSCATAAVVNVTATGPTASSWVGVDPLNGRLPNTSVLNFSPGQTVANQAVVPLGGGDAYVDNHVGTVHLVADLQGYVFQSDAPECGTKSPFFPIDPTRILDTRDGTGAAKAPLAGDSTLTVKVAGTHGVPAGARAVLVNLTGVTPTAGTWLSAYPHGTARPATSNLNLAPGAIRPNLALVPIGEDGAIDIYNHVGTVHVVADIEGYYLGQ